MKIIILLGVIQGFIISFVLLGRSSSANKTSHRLLALFILVLSLVNLEDYLILSGQIFAVLHIYGVFSPLVFTLGPLFYLYIKQISAQGEKQGYRQFLHFLPALLLFALLAITFYFKDATEKRQLIAEDINTKEGDLFLYAMVIQSAVYVWLSIRLILKHNRDIRQNFSFTEGINLNIQLSLLITLIFMWLFWGLGYFLFPTITNNIDDVVFTLFVYFFGYAALLQGRGVPLQSIPLTPTDEPINKKALNNNQPDAGLIIIYNKVLAYMESAQPYLQQELGIQQLADMMGIGVNQLSQAINSVGGQNFFDFVNSYRIEEFKKRVTDPGNQNFTLLAIALDSGFSSKAAFNSLFKKKTGITPSQYKNRVTKV